MKLPIQLNKTSYKKIIFSVYILSFFILTLAFLIATPKAVKKVESKIVFLGNQKQETSAELISQAIGQEKITTATLIQNPVNPPNFSAKAVLALDFETDKILFQKNNNLRLPPASTTKIMTALLAVDKYKPADILTVPTEAMVGGSTMGLKVGERLTFRSLLYGMMLNSGNDAAYTIAANFPGGIEQFVLEMNKKAQSMGLTDTHFQNPAGFDNSSHYSSANDLSKIAKAAVANLQLAKVVATKETSIVSYDRTNEHALKNLNKLLDEEGMLGIKTGYTENAGESFVGLVERKAHKILTVVLNSEDRFGETRELINWVYGNFIWN